MMQTSVPKSEKTPWTRTRRWWIWLMLFLMMGTLMFIFLYPTTEILRPLRTSSASSNNITTVYNCFVAYPHPYRFIVDEPHRCWQERPFLVLMIPVAPHNREARDVIRNTWGKETTVQGHVVSYYFLLGLSGEGEGSEVLEEQLLQESRRHHDMLQSDFMDSYKNLTIKTMVMFEWLNSHCPNTSYAMKVDADMFLNVHNLVYMLMTAPRHLFMTGRVARGSAVLRDHNSKWFMPVSAFPESTYPPYAMGLGYVFSMDLPIKILEASLQIRAIYVEDVYVGLCMRHLGVTLTDPPHSGLFRESRPYFAGNCYWSSVITTILQDSDQLWDVWGIYQTQVLNGC
ncbi:beta-1,3-galactosyltransferase 2-like [Hippoglossus hippoglossus]|uniref:beta-1,3-galactosyltransferase 2-like n=1 Tax=Hippoglossus hippoglossus TaxID=8267 RepID=UPI00148C5709|nr:beta-1,3-galactosyltransferase 2-like [Hippoglossus hippoglossus]